MKPFNFISYEPVTGQSYLGLATVEINVHSVDGKFLGRVTHRYKYVQGKSNNTFLSPASYKVDDKWVHAFSLEGKLKDDVESFVKESIKKSQSEDLPF